MVGLIILIVICGIIFKEGGKKKKRRTVRSFENENHETEYYSKEIDW